jgi:hypothetical protein
VYTSENGLLFQKRKRKWAPRLIFLFVLAFFAFSTRGPNFTFSQDSTIVHKDLFIRLPNGDQDWAPDHTTTAICPTCLYNHENLR